ncbi:MAG: DUF3857 and transglutaminase domain-containing protein [Acidobacteriaceae bacterium]
MTSQPQVPGASAIMLSRAEIVDDNHGTWTYIFRIKILNQAGRDRYSNVSIEYPGDEISDYELTSIAARTIHSDGGIIPFTGKPFDRVVASVPHLSQRQTVFTFPDVRVGSILEYTYTLKLRPLVFTFGFFTRTFIPTFYAQTELFARKVSFFWHATGWPVARSSSLPGGFAAIKVEEKSRFNHDADISIDLENVMPLADEPNMPPSDSLAQRVVFYDRLPPSVHSAQDFWNITGKAWSKDVDDFMGSSSKLRKADAVITAGATTPEDKLRRIYAAVQQMENTDFHPGREQTSAGLINVTSAVDILDKKRGNSERLTILFIGLARAAGFKAYLMAVTNRNRSRFDPQLATMQQLDDDIAIVDLNGKELALDPAEPFCPFGQLHWTHSDVGGLRQTPTGVALAASPSAEIRDTETRSVASLTIDLSGHESGVVDIQFTGAPALHYRQSLLLDDELSLHHDLEQYLRDSMPPDTDVTLQSIENLRDGDKPLIVHFQVSGPLGRVTGKSSFVPAQLFRSRDTAMFTDPIRTLPIEFPYPEIMRDTVRLQYPSTWRLEATPAAESDAISGAMSCDYNVQLAPNVIILLRTSALSVNSVAPGHYAELLTYDNEVTAKDHEIILFRTQPAPTPAR